MKILTIQTGHNATVGLIEEGKVTALLSQEKLDNIKNSAAFPSDAVRAVLAERGLSADDIDDVGIASVMIFPQHCQAAGDQDAATDHMYNSLAVRLAKRMEKVSGGAIGALLKQARTQRHGRLRAEALELLALRLAELGLANKPLSFVDHHLCHARSAYHAFPSEGEALIFTLDGMGDGLCATVTIADSTGRWEKIAETPLNSSLGIIYSETTRFLGMKPMEHEYKVMGLSAYCKGYHIDTYNRIFRDTIDIDAQNPLQFKAAFHTSEFYDYLAKHAVGERFDNIAGAVQELVEDRVTRWIANAISATGISQVFVGGGVFMNVKLNKRIQEMPAVTRVNFLPSCGDESNPLGAAYELAQQRGEKVKPLDHLYLGISYSRGDLAQFIRDNDLASTYTVSEPADIEVTIAELLARQEVVARFSGRCEWGARSLGNRAILAHPSFMESFYTVNDLIKARDFWMPFAPSILDRTAAKYLEGYNPDKAEAPYMITAFKTTPAGIKELRAAMHQGDFTVRPQVVTKAANGEYYRLIEHFESLSGVGAVLNTSLNLHGYPLVATPEQTIDTLARSGMRNVALGPFLIQKR